MNVRFVYRCVCTLSAPKSVLNVGLLYCLATPWRHHAPFAATKQRLLPDVLCCAALGCMTAAPSLCLPWCLAVHKSLKRLAVWEYIFLYVCPSVRPSACPPVRLSVCASVLSLLCKSYETSTQALGARHCGGWVTYVWRIEYSTQCMNEWTENANNENVASRKKEKQILSKLRMKNAGI